MGASPATLRIEALRDRFSFTSSCQLSDHRLARKMSPVNGVMTNGVGGPKQNFDPRLHDIVLVDQLPSDMWSEGVAVRPSGDVLTTRLDDPDLYVINCASAGPLENEFDSVPPQLVHRFAPEANGCFNICKMQGTEREEYAVISGNADLANGKFSSWACWRIVMPSEDSEDEPEIVKIADLKDAHFLMGIVALSNNTLAVVDSNKGCVWRIDIPSGKVTILLEEPEMQPPQGVETIFGMNRVQFTDKFGWFINTGNGTFYRFPIKKTEDGDSVERSGPVEVIASGFENVDGLVMTKDGSSGYMCSFSSGHLWRVDLDGPGGSGKGTTHVVRKDLVSPTGMDLVYHKNEPKPSLYVICCGMVDLQLLDGERGQWLGLGNIDRSKLQIHVTVTTEVTYEYI